MNCLALKGVSCLAEALVLFCFLLQSWRNKGKAGSSMVLFVFHAPSYVFILFSFFDTMNV